MKKQTKQTKPTASATVAAALAANVLATNRASGSRPGPGPKPLPYRNLRRVPGDVVVKVYEGMELVQIARLASKLAKHCKSIDMKTTKNASGLERAVLRPNGKQDYTATNTVRPQYVSQLFGGSSYGGGGSVVYLSEDDANKLNSHFVIVARKKMPDGKIRVGFLFGTLYSSKLHSSARKVLYVDLICAQNDNPNDVLKGTGNILMEALHTYATKYVGANMIALSSVKNRNTWQFYINHGFKRTVDPCQTGGDASERDAYYKQVYNHFVEDIRDIYEEHVDLLKGRYFPHHDRGLVYLTKCLPGRKTNMRGVLWKEDAPINRDVPAKFSKPSAYVLDFYRADHKYTMRRYKMERPLAL
jgi:hypothetical protein